MAEHHDAEFIALQTALAGEYSLDREIGRGGMGVVYLAREVRLARPVAIKVLPSALAARPELREAFLSEARTAASLTHPNIVQVFAAGERGGFVFIVMSYVEGITLGQRIRTRGPLLPGQAARVLREVAWALAYAHGRGLVHRDVSAENILLERGSERALVTDFGIASAMQTNALSADGRVMGNAHYVSPEQASGEPLDARSDLYSLGITGYYALTGRLPFDAPTAGEVVTKHLTVDAPSITSVAPSVPPRLAAAVERCLHKMPIRRYRNAESFAEAIDLAFEHAKEIPAPLRYWLNQGEKEQPARIAVAGVGAMAGVTTVLSTGMTWTFVVPFGLLAGLSAIPWLTRLRTVLRDGYVADDLHAAMREHQLVRAEEIEYELRQQSPWFKRVMRVTLGVSSGMFAIGAAMAWEYYTVLEPVRRLSYVFKLDTEFFVWLVLFTAGCGLTISGVTLAADFIRFRLSTRIAAGAISFWKSKWGARLAKLASFGIKPAERPAIGMPLLTEIALGRATDHLFDALPKASRKQLASLPATVRRLEVDAGRLRDSIAKLDDQLAVFEVGRGGAHDAEREAMARELRETRAIASQRLASTVGALENIRLDLLRLQMGTAGLESVTASLEAARSAGEQIGVALDASREVEKLLAPREHAPHLVIVPREAGDDIEAYDPVLEQDEDDADTPVSGVPAASA